MEKEIAIAVEELKQQGKEVYAKLVASYEKKDWLNYSVLSDQIKFIKEDIAKLSSNNQEVVR